MCQLMRTSGRLLLVQLVENIDTYDCLHRKKYTQYTLAFNKLVQGAPIKNNPLEKINYLSYCKGFFSPNLQLLQRRFQAT